LRNREAILRNMVTKAAGAGTALFAPVPGADGTRGGGDKTVSSTVTNNINVNSPDPGAAAAAVGLHLDRTAADVARNLQGVAQ
jgi:hypothetical protein